MCGITITQEESLKLEEMIAKHGLGEVVKEIIYICSFHEEIDFYKEITKIVE